MILVNAVFYFTLPDSHTTNLGRAAVTFHDQQIPGYQPELVEFAVKQLDLMYFFQVESATQDICNSEKGKWVVCRGALWLLLNSSLYFS